MFRRIWVVQSKQILRKNLTKRDLLKSIVKGVKKRNENTGIEPPRSPGIWSSKDPSTRATWSMRAAGWSPSMRGTLGSSWTLASPFFSNVSAPITLGSVCLKDSLWNCKEHMVLYRQGAEHAYPALQSDVEGPRYGALLLPLSADSIPFISLHQKVTSLSYLFTQKKKKKVFWPQQRCVFRIMILTAKFIWVCRLILMKNDILAWLHLVL